MVFKHLFGTLEYKLENIKEGGKQLLMNNNFLMNSDEVFGPNINYDYCFPEDIWLDILKYLNFLQIAKLSQVNHFFNSICKPLLKDAKIQTFQAQIKIENDFIKYGSITHETSLKGLSNKKIESFISKCLDEYELFPVKELWLEQNLAYFSSKWLFRWSIFFKHIIPLRRFISSLTLKNVHISKKVLLKYLIPSKSLKNLTLENVIFDKKVFIGNDLFGKLKTLENLKVVMSPSVICDKCGLKYAATRLYDNEQNFYCRFGSVFSYKTQNNLGPHRNFNVKTFWILKFYPFIYTIFTYGFLHLAYNIKINNLHTIIGAFIFPGLFLAFFAVILRKLLISQRYIFLPIFACFLQLKFKTMKNVPFFLYPFLYIFILILIFGFFFANFASCLSFQIINEQTLIQLRIPVICINFYFIFNASLFCFLNFFG